ncbi:MAG: flagellar biosynthesis protein FlhF [Armatimonadetes bacterium]|nr:flagellar biosynthesis protein FlhF [Armatimonadota bacterium]
MRIKTFEAPTMQEALVLAKMEFGEDAVVLNTKRVKSGGLLGLGGSDRVELMAAADEMAMGYSAPESVSAPAYMLQPAVKRGNGEGEAPAEHRVDTYSPGMSSLAARTYSETRNVATAEPLCEMDQLRNELKQLAAMVNGLMGSRTDVPVAEAAIPLLMRFGVDEDLARGILADLLSIEDPNTLVSALAAKMQAFAHPPVSHGRQVIALVGPTGVGKTTTLAKLAAKFALEQGKKVALVTADTYRIGAVDQLRTYARIIGIPVEIALSPEEVSAGVEKHRDKDVVLIDTVGRSQRNEDHLMELKSFVAAASPTDTHLVVSASLSGEIQREVVEKFTVLCPTKLIITKLDESADRGCLVNLPLRTGLAVSCTTAGQNVPQDIDFAEPGKLARNVITEVV